MSELRSEDSFGFRGLDLGFSCGELPSGSELHRLIVAISENHRKGYRAPASAVGVHRKSGSGCRGVLKAWKSCNVIVAQRGLQLVYDNITSGNHQKPLSRLHCPVSLYEKRLTLGKIEHNAYEEQYLP